MPEEIKRILRIRDVIEITGLSRSTIYLYMSSGGFPKPIKLGAHRIGWTDVSIQKWISFKIEES